MNPQKVSAEQTHLSGNHMATHLLNVHVSIYNNERHMSCFSKAKFLL